MAYFVYILRTSGNTLYVGQTNDLKKRMIEHTNKKGAKYLRMFTGFELVYQEKYRTRSRALMREVEIKKWTKSQKEALIGSGNGIIKRSEKSDK